MKSTTALKLLVGAVFGAAAFAATAADDSHEATAMQGEYVARAADCAACHTASDGGKAYAGGYAIQSPLGTIYATNITPSKTAGIGNWSEAQFARAVRQGVAADGHHLYPAMPYADYSGISDADIHALYVYLTTQVAAVDTPPTQVTKLGFPYGIRGLMGFWNQLFVDKPDTSAPAPQDPLARGRYLVDTLGHCGSCHTPRNLFMASDKDQYLAGGDVAGWHAPNITSDPVSGIGDWSEDELAQFLKTGHVAGKAQAAGGMAEAVEHSLRHLSDSDLHAMAAYLKQVPAKAAPGQDKPASSYGQAPAQAYGFDDPDSTQTLRDAAASTPTGDALLASRTYTDAPKVEDGARLYADACASCHQPNGGGTGDHYYPSLSHNSAVGAARPNNLVMAILHGVDRTGADGPTYMPAFARDMTDAQVAAVASYVSQRFGNPATKVDAKQVAELRAGGPAPALKALTPWLLGLGVLVIVVLLLLVSRLFRRRKAA
ncbi:cytochrome c [Pseudoxanthomonas sp.]|uniref:c-type cytochrome n=1 Tax=Pseudoxanthomonas sp. TaxID=1871049 RepID=UPI0026268815|nr:cytochrome c [Pseudoxanthomonas sp.]WDS34962.1 MAG: cytochrome c [Pseudoxanthomonas sp.]